MLMQVQVRREILSEHMHWELKQLGFRERELGSARRSAGPKSVNEADFSYARIVSSINSYTCH